MREWERLKGLLWLGNVYQALQGVQSVELDLDAAVATGGHGTARKRLKAVEEFHPAIMHHHSFRPTYGACYPARERKTCTSSEAFGSSASLS